VRGEARSQLRVYYLARLSSPGCGRFCVSTGIHYQDTARGIRKELSFHKVFLKAAKPLALIGRMVPEPSTEDRIQGLVWALSLKDSWHTYA
jgi:hypothetical protein